MNFPVSAPSSRLQLLRMVIAFSLLSAFGALLPAQQPSVNVADVQREAMHKLAFLSGHWSGPIAVTRGPGEPIHLTQTESVEYKLDGLVMLVEGKSVGVDGKSQFQALATLSFDDATHTYRIRTYHDGHYVDTELTMLADGFSWGFASGPAHVVNTMHLTAGGQWQETTDVTVGASPAMRSVDMLLDHQPKSSVRT